MTVVLQVLAIISPIVLAWTIGAVLMFADSRKA